VVYGICFEQVRGVEVWAMVSLAPSCVDGPLPQGKKHASVDNRAFVVEAEQGDNPFSKSRASNIRLSSFRAQAAD
jgi:hypothetical protein